MSFFSSDVFLESAREAYYPDKEVSIGFVNVGGKTYRVLVDSNHRALTEFPFLDVIEPWAGKVDGPVKDCSYLHPVDLGRVEIDAWLANPKEGQVIGPYIDWTLFPDFDTYRSMAKEKNPFCFRSKNKGRKALQKVVGSEPIEFKFHDPRPSVIDDCLRWKSAQYVDSGFQDVTKGGAARLFHILLEKDSLNISSITAGEQTLAVHLGPVHEGILYYWMTAYEPAVGKGSPGTVMLEEMMRESYENGHSGFDFLEGSENYKFRYSTHVRLIGGTGTPPLRDRVVPQVKAFVKDRLKSHPRALESLRSFKKKYSDKKML